MTTLRVIPVEDATRSYNCKEAGCEEPAKASRGRYAYLCDTHKREHATRLRPVRGKTYTDRALALLPLARKLDAALASYGPVRTDLLLAMKAWADAVEALK